MLQLPPSEGPLCPSDSHSPSHREKAKGLSTHTYQNPLSMCSQDLSSLARQLGQAIHPLEDGA